MTQVERHLIRFLRGTALMFLSAAFAVIMPYEWMNAISEAIQLGPLPNVPLMAYLTRSVSALYAVMGASYWFISRDVRRYLPLLRFTVPLTLAFDVTVIALDILIPMPLVWTIGESVSILAWTAGLWWLVRRVSSEPETNSGR